MISPSLDPAGGSMNPERWAAAVTWLIQLGAISISIAAVLGLCSWAARGLWRVWRLGRKLNRWLDQALGDKEAGLPSLMDRIESIEGQLADHLEWHSDPRGLPAKPVQPWPNGTLGRPGEKR